MTRPTPDWGPYLFDDHGQPLCTNTAEEQLLWAELVADGIIPPPESHNAAWDPDNEPPY